MQRCCGLRHSVGFGLALEARDKLEPSLWPLVRWASGGGIHVGHHRHSQSDTTRPAFVLISFTFLLPREDMDGNNTQDDDDATYYHD